MMAGIISRKKLLAFPKPAADIIVHLVNDHGWRYRMPDGVHIILYAPDGSTRKTGRSRKAEAQVQALTKWARELGCEHL